MDIKPKKLSEDQKLALRALGRQVMSLLEQRKKINQFQEAQNQRDRLFNYALDLYCIAGFDGYFKQINPAWKRTLGRSNEELLAKPYMEFIHPDDYEETLNAFTTMKNGKNLLLFENRHRCKNGSYRWLSWVASPEFEEGLIFAVARDVTSQKHAEKQLQKITELHRAIQENAGYAIVSTSSEGVITSFNPAAEHMFGYSATEVVNLKTPALFHKSSEVVARAQELSNELSKTITPGFEVFTAKARLNLPCEDEWTYIRKDGTHFPVILSITALRDESGEINGFLGIAIDITERKQMERVLEQFKYTLDQTVDCVFICDSKNFRFEYVNEGAKQQVGYSEAELFEMTVPEIKTQYSLDEYRVLVQPLLDGNKPSLTFETIHKHKSGQEIPVEVTMQLVRQENEKPRLVAVVRDISDRKRVEKLLRTKNEELKSFAYTVSHDLKAPLRGISGYGQELIRRHQEGLSERAQFCIEQIITASHNLDRLIEDLLIYSRVDSEMPTTTEIDLCVLIQGIMQDRSLVVTERDIDVIIDVPAIKLKVWERGLHQVLTNLIDNAIKYSCNAKPPRLSISAKQTATHCIISVKDNGVGFNMKYHDRIFGLFNRLVRADEFEGTGAGLAIVAKLLKKLNGKIHAESKVEQGATFFVELPISAMSVLRKPEL
ncbi:PAS domain S-box protein [Colwellia sp. MSW7]|uniref:histidine kinase n=1 Tax=Colwellia maritima TaxID=2912588 RepID=A0ABS9X0U8_9GAMM|nr:PAS domain-containing sensor histidine kinase [Colwellia maritima]MCI2283881.1 PAS domain S-box protein [Colwellia maritima]